MLPKKSRFTRADFLLFSKHTNLQTVFNRLGTFKYLLGTTKIGVVTSSKHEKRAVVRNKLRRRVYTLSKEVTSLQAVLYASKHAYGMDFDEVHRLFYDLMAKAQKNPR